MLKRTLLKNWRRGLVAAGAAGFALVHTQAAPASRLDAAPYRPDRILVQPKHGTSLETLGRFRAARHGQVLQTFARIGRLQIVALPEGADVPALITQYQQSGLVEFAEPDYIGRPAATPNDPAYPNGLLWGLANIDAPGGWDVLTSASNVIVAVVDTGVRATHQDLAANIWINPNGGGHGLNALAPANPPDDDNGHGTMVAGVLGAVGNNGLGVVGVAWRVQILACKACNQFGQPTTSACITCLDYASTNHARIINASWGLPDSLALSNAVSSLRADGVILVAACGNSGANVDLSPTYPACYPLDNVLSVAYTTRDDLLAGPSNYGPTNVHLAAPGDQIYSTFGATDSYYYTLSGTSMAAPYVSGALALLVAQHPAETCQQIVARLLNATDPLPSLQGKCVTSGRLNLRHALNPPIRLSPLAWTASGSFQLRLSADPNRTCVLQASPDLAHWSPIFTNTTSAQGAFDFTDAAPTNLAHRFSRAVAP